MSNNNFNKKALDIERILSEAISFNVLGDLLVRQIENEAILLHIPTGAYYNLSETSLPFWEALQNQQPLQPVVNQIIDRYEVEPSRVIEDLQTFLEDLLEFGMIRESPNT